MTDHEARHLVALQDGLDNAMFALQAAHRAAEARRGGRHLGSGTASATGGFPPARARLPC
jgi:hypothetical protein